jgi:UDP-N-acetylmuramate: L-alanyl-gamma-D-glutamyl-meso-diaminopimelate ligase
VEGLLRRGIAAVCGGSAEQIVESLAPRMEPDDVVLIMSNGGFDGIHRKLVEALAHRTQAEQVRVVH